MSDNTAVRKYVLSGLAGFLADPADNAFQEGYREALECVARDALHIPDPTAAARELLQRWAKPDLKLVEEGDQ